MDMISLVQFAFVYQIYSRLFVEQGHAPWATVFQQIG